MKEIKKEKIKVGDCVMMEFERDNNFRYEVGWKYACFIVSHTFMSGLEHREPSIHFDKDFNFVEIFPSASEITYSDKKIFKLTEKEKLKFYTRNLMLNNLNDGD